MSNILNMARIVRNEEISVARTLGLPYNQFIADWRAYYSVMNLGLLESYVEPDADKKISSKTSKSASLTDVSISPDGNLLAYASMSLGQFEVRVIDLNTRKESVLL